MKSKWSKSWRASKQPRKQRKYLYNIPLHLSRKLMSVHLNKELKQKYGKRNTYIRKGDSVKIMVGQFKKKTGKVERVDVKHRKVYVEGICIVKKDGTKLPYPIYPSNLMITNLEIGDKIRKKIIERR